MWLACSLLCRMLPTLQFIACRAVREGWQLAGFVLAGMLGEHSRVLGGTTIACWQGCWVHEFLCIACSQSNTGIHALQDASWACIAAHGTARYQGQSAIHNEQVRRKAKQAPINEYPQHKDSLICAV